MGGRAKEKVQEEKKVMEEKEREKAMVAVRKVARGKVKGKEKEREKESQEPWLSSWTDKEREKEKEEKEKEKEALVEKEEKEVMPAVQPQCHQLRISLQSFLINLQLRFVCSPPWDGLTLTSWLIKDKLLGTS